MGKMVHSGISDTAKKKLKADGISPADFNGMTEAKQSEVLSGAAIAANNSSNDNLKNTVNDLGILSQESQTIKDNWMGFFKGTGQVNHALKFTKELIESEQVIRTDVVKQMGLSGALQRQTTNDIMKAQGEARKYGVEFADTQRTVMAISKEFGRGAVTFSDDDLARVSIFQDSLGLYASDMAKITKGFFELGLGMGKTIDRAQDMTNIARDMGVNMDAFMGNINANMSMLNTYNFADGVEGFARMAAQSAKIGLSMGKVAEIAEKVMDPEGAIELSTKLQVIGGAVGDLADPFKLMYMATNDLEGLGKAIANVGGDLAVFNEQTGQIEFPPTAQRQLRELADAIGIGKEELASMIKTQKMFEMMQNQMDLSAFDDAGLTEFVTSMAAMGEDGQFEIKIPGINDGDPINLDEIENTTGAMDALLELQQNQNLTEKDVALESRDILKSINDNIAGADRSVKAGMLSDNGGASIQKAQLDAQKNITKFVDSDKLFEFGENVSETIGTAIKGIAGATGKEMETMAQSFGNVLQAGGKTLMAVITDGIGSINTMSVNELMINGGAKENDFSVAAGETQAVLTNNGVILPSSKDVVSGIAMNAETKGAELGGIKSNNTKMPEVLVKFGGNIPLTIDGKNMGKMSSNEIWNLITKNPVLLHQIKMELAGITNDSPLPGQQQIRHMEV